MIALTLHIPEGKVAEYLTAEAVKRSCRPEQMALALISCAAASNLTDAILDDFQPAGLLTERTTRRPLQTRVIRAMHAFLAPNNTVIASYSDLANYIGSRNRGAVRNAVAALVRKHLVETISTGKSGEPSRYRFTLEGTTFVKEIGS